MPEHPETPDGEPVAEIAAASFGSIDPGKAWMALPFRVDADTTEEVIAACEAFAKDLGELVDRHPAIVHLGNKVESLQCLEHGAAIARAVLEQQTAERAKRN